MNLPFHLNPDTYKATINIKNHDKGQTPRRRRRPYLSCVRCHQQKVKCDRKIPCSRCTKSEQRVVCHYLTTQVSGDRVFSTFAPSLAGEVQARYGSHDSNYSPICSEDSRLEADGYVEIASSRLKGSDYDSGDLSTATTDLLVGKNPSLHQTKPIFQTEHPQVLQDADWNPALTIYRKGKVKFRGPTHWSPIVVEFENILPYLFGGARGFSDMSGQLKELKRFYHTRRTRNYPFAHCSNTAPFSKLEIVSSLPSCDIVDEWVRNYMDTFGRTHRLFHIPTLFGELESFWNDPTSVDSAWLSQLLTMLALGCPRDEKASKQCLMDAFLDGAEACLMQTSFMFRPSLEILRTLCLMTIAKQIDIVSFDDSDAVWMLMGFVIRSAMAMGLHRDPKYFVGMPRLEGEIRKRIWTTIVFMDLQNAIESGMPVLLRSADFDCTLPSNLNDHELSEITEPNAKTEANNNFTDSSLQILIAKSFPIAFEILRSTSSASVQPNYNTVLKHDESVQKLLQIASKTFAKGMENDKSSGGKKRMILQHKTIDIYLRRLLLSLHRPFARPLDALEVYPKSYLRSLECSLALLVHQRSLYEDSTEAISIEWFAELFKGDFFIAALYVCLALRRKHFGLPENISYEIPAKKIVWETLKACLEIWEQKIGISVDHYKAHLSLGMIIASLTVENEEIEILKVMTEAAQRSINAVLKHKDIDSCCLSSRQLTSPTQGDMSLELSQIAMTTDWHRIEDQEMMPGF